MTRLYVVKSGQTTWEAESRMDPAAGAPLSAEGARQARLAAGELAGRRIVVVYCGNGEAERQTARAVAKALGVKVKTRHDLRELDYGLWQGLTIDQIKRRQPKVFRRWRESPQSVCPPGGETLGEAEARLRTVLQDIVKRHKDEHAVLVLRPVLLALLGCVLDGGGTEDFWQRVGPDFTWGSYEVDCKSI